MPQISKLASSGSKDSIIGAALVQYKYPAGPNETAVELPVNPALFGEAFAADLPAETVALMAATQRPTAVTRSVRAAGLEEAAVLDGGHPVRGSTGVKTTPPAPKKKEKMS